jgi:putative tricarboxylic transport membrane protein
MIFLAATVQAASAPVPLARLDIIVPGSPGGGFDKNAQALAQTLRAEKLVDRIVIRHSPGAGGLIALAQFVGEPAPTTPTLFLGGTTILGSAAQNRSVVSLDDLAPIAQLNRIALIIVARKDGPAKSIDDLITLMRSQPNRVGWVGGSPGSKDEMLLIALARHLRLPRDRLAYIANPGGGAVVGEQLLAGRHVAATTSLEEFRTFADRDKFRILAVSSDTRLPGIDAPTLREAGIDLAIDDWKGVFASAKASPEELDKLRTIVVAALESPAWKRELAAQGWTAAPPPSTFPAAIANAQAEARTLITYVAPTRSADAFLSEVLAGPWRYFLYALGGAAVLGVIVLVQGAAGRRRKAAVHRAESELEEIRIKTAEHAAGERTDIARQLKAWGLSSAEMEVAWMILKGLQFKEVAAARGTSERTVRQQAQTVYAKSGMANRTEFAAHFLETYRF